MEEMETYRQRCGGAATALLCCPLQQKPRSPLHPLTGGAVCCKHLMVLMVVCSGLSGGGEWKQRSFTLQILTQRAA